MQEIPERMRLSDMLSKNNSLSSKKCFKMFLLRKNQLISVNCTRKIIQGDHRKGD